MLITRYIRFVGRLFHSLAVFVCVYMQVIIYAKMAPWIRWVSRCTCSLISQVPGCGIQSVDHMVFVSTHISKKFRAHDCHFSNGRKSFPSPEGIGSWVESLLWLARQVKRCRSKGGLAGVDGMKSVFGQLCSKMSLFGPESLMLPHRIWKVKFIGWCFGIF